MQHPFTNLTVIHQELGHLVGVNNNNSSSSRMHKYVSDVDVRSVTAIPLTAAANKQLLLGRASMFWVTGMPSLMQSR